MEGVPQLFWRADAAGRRTWSSSQWSDYTGLRPQESLGDGWLSAVHPQDRVSQMAEWKDAQGSGTLLTNHRLFEADATCYRRFQTHATAMLGPEGEVIEWLGASVEVEDLRHADETHQATVLELKHRMRNTLSVIRSIARRTARTSGTLKNYVMHLEGRLDAVARIQSALMRDPVSGLDLGEMISDELLAYAAREGNRLRIGGPPVRIRAKAATIVGLAIHELTTNAVKFGALARPEATLDIDWSVMGTNDSLNITWKEGGMKLAARKAKRGFGMEILAETMAYELKVDTQIEFERDGLRCVMVLPRGALWDAGQA